MIRICDTGLFEFGVSRLSFQGKKKKPSFVGKVVWSEPQKLVEEFRIQGLIVVEV